MIELIKKIFDAKDAYQKQFSGVPDLLFMHPDFLIVVLRRDDFEVWASTEDQMKLLSEKHVGTTSDIKLGKLIPLPDPEEPTPEFHQHEYVTIPYFILEAYRKHCKQSNVDKLW
ncbi:hypothetical protein PY247_12880 [Acinetobacter proteolyticus]|nr:hypothetical protein [Acinetobacter proteolyticus]WEI17385.1 hypothetical protein PY247_12880 [Acinetobacter proteolyticus]